MVNWGLGNFDQLKQLKPPKVANKQSQVGNFNQQHITIRSDS